MLLLKILKREETEGSIDYTAFVRNMSYGWIIMHFTWL